MQCPGHRARRLGLGPATEGCRWSHKLCRLGRTGRFGPASAADTESARSRSEPECNSCRPAVGRGFAADKEADLCQSPCTAQKAAASADTIDKAAAPAERRSAPATVADKP